MDEEVPTAAGNVRRKVLRNAGTDTEPYWVFIPAIQPAPQRFTPVRLAFADRRSFGYGGPGTPWPFDVERAKVDRRYRTGINNAINAYPQWTDAKWRKEAGRILAAIVEFDRLIEETMTERRRKEFMREMASKYL